MVSMCPDRELISLYHDGELPSPWKGKLETHLESCKNCRAVYSGYKRLGENIQYREAGLALEKSMLAAQERIWQKLSQKTQAEEQPAEVSLPDKPAAFTVIRPPKRVWNRNIILPLPVAAAAAVVVMVMFFAVLGIRSKPQPAQLETTAVADMGFDEKGIVPVTDMNGVLQYLSSQDSGDFMVVRLPENTKFSRSGDPALVNAADYSRRNVSR